MKKTLHLLLLFLPQLQLRFLQKTIPRLPLPLPQLIHGVGSSATVPLTAEMAEMSNEPCGHPLHPLPILEEVE